MKYRVTIVIVFLLVILVSASETDAATYSAQEMYEKQIHFIACTDTNGDFFEISYSEIDDEILFQILKNGVQWRHMPVLETGLNTGYFHIVSKNSDGTYNVAGEFWTGTMWHTLGLLFALPAGENAVGLPPMEDPSEQEILQGKLIIWWPPYDGYRFSTSVQSVQYQFGIQGTDSSQVSISITGADSKQVLSRDIRVIDGWIYGTCKDEIQLNVGQNNITVTATAGNNSVSATRIVEVLAGQVDEDGDGLDDRTGMPIWPDDPINWGDDGPPPLPGENATIFDYIKWFADSVIYSLMLLVTTIKSFMSGIGQVTRMFAEMFKWLPSELIAIMILGICMTIILRVLGR